MSIVKVFIFAGQSNAGGFGNSDHLNPRPAWLPGPVDASSDTGAAYDRPTAASFPALYNSNNTGLFAGVFDAWGPYLHCGPKYPSGSIMEEGGYGPELAFLWKYRQDHPGEQIAVLKVTLGGSSIGEWLSPSNMGGVLDLHIDQAKSRFAAAGLTPEWAGMFWMQGENGCSNLWIPDGQYAADVRALLAYVRARTSPALPAIIGRVGSHMMTDAVLAGLGGAVGQQGRDTVNRRRAEQVAVGQDANNCWLDTDNLPVLQQGDPAWWYHHTGPGYLAMGERAYAAFSVGSPPPPPPPPPTVKFNGQTVTGWTVNLNGSPVGTTGDVIDIEGDN